MKQTLSLDRKPKASDFKIDFCSKNGLLWKDEFQVLVALLSTKTCLS